MTAKRVALCIGLNYPGTEYELAGCAPDARAWSAALTGRGFQTTMLLDADGTKRNMVDAINSIIGGAAYGDRVVITYSGHGTWVPDRDGDEADGRDEALCPADIGSGAVIIDDDLNVLFSAVKRGVRLTFISDSCHSGTVMRFAGPPLSAEAGETATRKIRFLPPAVFLSRKAVAVAETVAAQPFGTMRKHPGVLMAGCTDQQYSYDAVINGKPNGAFTAFALQALRKLPPAATYRDWRAAIAGLLPSKDYPQTPQITGSAAQLAWQVFI